MDVYEEIKKNQNNIISNIKRNALQYHRQHFSVQAEAKSYKKIFDKILPQNEKLFTYPDVHPVSEINMKLYEEVPEQILQKWFQNSLNEKRIIDIGCGSGIFSFTLLQKFLSAHQS